MKLRSYLAVALLAVALPAGLSAQAGPGGGGPGGPGGGFGGPGGGGPPAAAPQELTYEMAKAAAEAAEAFARQNNWNMAIVVADAEGTPIYLKRMNGAPKRIYDFAMGKMRTVIASGLSTKDYAAGVAAGTVQAVPDAVTLEGGLPIIKDGRVIGAIGSSGVRPDQDAQVSQAGIDALGL
jgi:glc operon protein GlcG